jgi:hypothetical protein
MLIVFGCLVGCCKVIGSVGGGLYEGKKKRGIELYYILYPRAKGSVL